MVVTLKDVALRAGVSRSAVSRTFTEGASVSGKMREKVLEAAEQLGYRPNALASSLTTGTTGMVGLVSNNFHNPMFMQVFDLFTQKLQERGLKPLLVNLPEGAGAKDTIHMMQQYSVDGVVIASSTLPADFAYAFRKAGIPVVHTFARHTGNPNVHIVGIDNVEAGRAAAMTLSERSYTHVGFLGGPEHASTTEDRWKGFRDRIKRIGKMTVDVSFAEAYTFQAGRAAMQDILAQDDRPEAFFCGDDVIAIGALSAIQDAGLNCPTDIGLLGVNNMEIAAWNNINLTTIHQPLEEIIDATVRLVTKVMRQRGDRLAVDRPPEARLFPCHVVERGTLRPLTT
ncbi:LacI family DNA-binding transcriptional regulator [Aliiroseovarius sp. 2305UL8-7]|uniref:LacI family DNA-binding transcriptional regulator n=1 Tax=Aliiroseovarius conchicola TaxID=3121637 RepID=UPI003527C2B7